MSPPYAAELRVYEPLSAFPPAERRGWEAYAASGSVPSPRHGQRWERRVGLAAACRPTPQVPRRGAVGDHAYVLGSHTGLLICPWHTELRCWQAASELAALLPTELVPAVLPTAEIDIATEEQERWLTAHPDQRAHVLSSRWVVPVRWFLPFHRDERRLQLGPAPADAGAGADPSTGPEPEAAPAGPVTAVGRSLVYRTEMAQARRRMARALAVLRRAFDSGPVVGAVESLGRWLEEFHPRSVVELDYGGIVDLRSDAELRADDSVGDVAEALAAIADGDAENATRAYDRVIERWRIAHRVESAN